MSFRTGDKVRLTLYGQRQLRWRTWDRTVGTVRGLGRWPDTYEVAWERKFEPEVFGEKCLELVDGQTGIEK